jgi:hypothetical protein
MIGFGGAGIIHAGSPTRRRGPMLQINYYAVSASAVVALAAGAAWYSPLLFGGASTLLPALNPHRPAAASMAVSAIAGEFVRWLVVASVLARFMSWLGIGDPVGGMVFGLWMWIAIYLALAGSLLHEHYSWRLYAIYAGDGLVKILLITMILGLWRVR